MTTSKTIFEIPAQLAEPSAPDKAEVEQDHYGFYTLWQTPGRYLSEHLKTRQEVRFVGEKFQPDYLQTVIVLDCDPEELLETVFALEQELYHKYENLRFDIRVRVIPKQESIDTIRKNCIVYYERMRTED